MTEIVNVHEWVRLNNKEPQFWFIDDSFDKVERINDLCLFFLGDFVEYKNSSSQIAKSYIEKFDHISYSIVFMKNGDLVSINDIEWEEEFYNNYLGGFI